MIEKKKENYAKRENLGYLGKQNSLIKFFFKIFN